MFKGESHDRAHLLPSVPVTWSGINVRNIIDRLLEVKSCTGFSDGPAISTMNGKMPRSKDIDDMLHELLMGIFDLNRALFLPDITSHELISLHYQCYRTFRQSSDTRAVEQGVALVDIDVVNRWKRVKGSKGKVPSHTMQQRYAQFDMLLDPFF